MKNIELLFFPSMDQTPHFIHKANAPALLTPEQVKILQIDITKAGNIK